MKAPGWLESIQRGARTVSAGAGLLADTGGALADLSVAVKNAALSTGFPFEALKSLRGALETGDPTSVLLAAMMNPDLRAWVERWKHARPAKTRRRR